MATLREVRIDVSKTLKDLSDVDNLLNLIGRNLLVVSGERIFTDNQLSDGGDIISSYSTKPIYVPVRASSRLRPAKGKSKDSKARFKNGKLRKSRYLPRGYKELKEKVRRRLTLELTGQLKGAYQAFTPLKTIPLEGEEGAGSGKKELLMGFQDVKRRPFVPPKKKKKSKDLTNDELRRSLEKRFGVFTALSGGEEELINKTVENFINSKL